MLISLKLLAVDLFNMIEKEVWIYEDAILYVCALFLYYNSCDV